jgi:hypothetical protein
VLLLIIVVNVLKRKEACRVELTPVILLGGSETWPHNDALFILVIDFKPKVEALAAVCLVLEE